METTQSIALDLEARGYAYTILQSIFGTDPTEEQYAVLRGEEARSPFYAIDSTAEFKQARDDFFSFVSENPYSEKLAGEYTRLFIGPGALPAPPWESVYVGNDNLLLVESTIEVRKAYLSQGYAPKLFPHVADDHISLELDFLKRLSFNGAQAIEEGNALDANCFLGATESFLDSHMLKWIRRYCTDLAQATEGFYAKAALLLATFIEGEETALAVLRRAAL